MLAGVRCCFLLLFLLAFSVAVVLPVQAQVNGVPPSVTSMGFGGRVINGVPPSVTSFGPDGYNNRWSILGNCCANFLLPANPDPPLFSEHHHRHKDGASLAGVMEPVSFPSLSHTRQKKTRTRPMSTLTRRARRTRILHPTRAGTAIRFRWRTPKRMKKTRRLLSP